MKKKILVSTMLLFSLVICAIVSLRTVQKTKDLLYMISGDIEALSYSNEGPGPQGSRQEQAVWCCGGGWIVRAGCCFGETDCHYIFCPSGVCFSCDGNTWIGSL